MKKFLCIALTALLTLSIFSISRRITANAEDTIPVESATRELPYIVQIEAGGRFSLALFSNGRLWAWGDNKYGQLGDGTNTDRHKPVCVGMGFTKVSAGYDHVLALKGDELYAWGWNMHGELGDGTMTNRNTPTYIGKGFTEIAGGQYHSLALKGDALYAWGENLHGQLGNASTIIREVVPVEIGSGYTQIAAGREHSMALKGNKLYAWGFNDFGQVGDNTWETTRIPTEIEGSYTQIAAGGNHSLALRDDVLYVWGENIYGQLGDSDWGTVFRPQEIGPGYTTITAGLWHTLTLRGSTLYAWGYNWYGQIGIGPTMELNTLPSEVAMGFSQVSAGLYHSLALKGNELYVFGNNTSGQLGDGTMDNRYTPEPITFFIPIETLELDKTDIKLKQGDGETLTASVIPEDASIIDIVWSSTDESVATVDRGVITTHGQGSTLITITSASNPAIAATCKISVELPVENVSLAETTRSIISGEEFRLVPSIEPSNATNTTVFWGTSDEKIASVRNGIVTGVAPGKARITVASRYDPEKKAVCLVTVEEPVAGITISPSEREIKVGDVYTLVPKIEPSNATNQSVAWSSSNPKAAAVENGRIIAKSVGTATITAVSDYDPDIEASCEITVTNPVSSIVLSDEERTLRVGQEITISANVRPADAGDKSVVWSIDDESVASIRNGKVTALLPGRAVVTAATADGNKSATCAITVIRPVTGIRVQPAEMTMAAGETITLLAEIEPADATNRYISWATSNENIVTVLGGKVTAVSEGRATITAISIEGALTATCEITVVIPVASIDLDSKAAIEKGESFTLTPIISPENATNQNVSWVTNNARIAIVNDGEVTGIGEGEATISVITEDGRKTAVCQVTVTQK